MNSKYIPWVIAIVILAVAFSIHKILGVGTVLILGVIWAMNIQHANDVKRFGPELAKKIQKKQIEIGMQRSVVERIWGPAANVRKHVDGSGTMITCDHMLIEKDGRKRYRFYAEYMNDVLTKYGDN